MRRLTNDPRPRRRPRSRRALVALSALALAGLAPAVAPFGAARAQVAGPESFAKEPRTPEELWDAADYLVRSGQADRAVPYLRKFLAAAPDDETLLRIRDRYGLGSALRLDRFPETKPLARPLLDRLAAASRRHSTDPARLASAIKGLTASRAEQDYGVERLREAGPEAVPALLVALKDADRSREDRALIAANLGRLDRSAVPPLIAALDAPDATLATDAAEALGRIGDPRAVPALTYQAARRDKDASGAAGQAARDAIAKVTGRPFASQPRTPARVLADEARKYLVHAVRFPGETVELWEWRDDAPAPRTVPVGEAEGILGLRSARQALAIDPADAQAQATFVALALEKAVDRSGLDRFPAEDPTGAFPAALAAGPDVLGEVLRRAIADGHSSLAAAAATALGRVVDREALTANRRPSPLVEALSSPDRRAQFAAARALVEMEPARPFPGSSRVVPALARFVSDSPAPRAIVVDGNINRGNRVAGMMAPLGYEATAVDHGEEAFRLAAESADVEAVFIEPSGLLGAWGVGDTLKNLRTDARTAGLPVFLLVPTAPNAEQAYIDRGRDAAMAEREPNDDPARAQPLSVAIDTRRVRIQGALPSSDKRGDYYRLGPLRPGTTVLASVSLPPGSTLLPDEALMTLEREVLVGERRERRSFPVAETRGGRVAYLVPAYGEVEPPDPDAAPRRAAARQEAEAKGQVYVEPKESKTLGDYLIRVRPAPPPGDELAPARERGALARYVLDVAELEKVAPAPGTAAVRERLEDYRAKYPRVSILVPSTDANLWKRQVDSAMARMGVQPLSEAERTAYAREAAGLLARIASRPGGPLIGGLDRASSALTAALNSPASGLAASGALGDVPGVDAQRGLADAAIDPSRPADVRKQAAGSLARSLQRFGPLLAADQEARLLDALDREADPAIRAALASAVGALRPKPAMVGRRLPAYRLGTPPAPAPGDQP